MIGEYKANYHIRKLSDVGVSVLDCEHKTPPAAVSGYPYIAIPNIKDGRLDLDEVRLISRNDYEEWTRRTKPQAGDIILTRRARVGDTAVVPDGLECALGQNLVLLRSNEKQVNQKFLRWLLRSREYWEQVHKYQNEGATFSSLNVRDIPNFELPIPPLPIQRWIAQILGRLDDKIEVNRRTNRTLEAMAQALFKHWFVDFGPFQNGPFVESELGLVPEGWRVAPIGQHVKADKGLSYKGSGLADEGIPLHNLNSIYEGGGYKYEGIKYYTGEYKTKHIVIPGDLIVANTEQGFDYLLIGCPAIVPKRFGDFGLFTHHIFKITVLPASPLSTYYLYFLLKHPQFRDEVTAHTNGTTVNMLSKDGLNYPLIVVPTPAVVERFNKIVAPILGKVELNENENVKLAATRDYLLPKLLSGEVGV